MKARGARIATAIIVPLCISVAMYAYLGDELAYQQQRNQILERRISALAEQTQDLRELDAIEQVVLSKAQILELLDRSRALNPRLLIELGRTVPHGIVLTSVERSGNELRVEGKAQDADALQRLMERMKTSRWLDSVRHGERDAALGFALLADVRSQP